MPDLPQRWNPFGYRLQIRPSVDLCRGSISRVCFVQARSTQKSNPMAAGREGEEEKKQKNKKTTTMRVRRFLSFSKTKKKRKFSGSSRFRALVTFMQTQTRCKFDVGGLSHSGTASRPFYSRFRGGGSGEKSDSAEFAGFGLSGGMFWWRLMEAH